jgi:two-component system cell cycle response regulator
VEGPRRAVAGRRPRLLLPEESAYSLFRTLRTNPKTKTTPVFGLVVKTESAVQTSAQQVGITHIVTKPIDMAELESRMSKAMNLDISSRYFKIEANILTMSLPENCTPLVLSEVEQYLQPKLAEAVNAGINKVVIDVFPIRYLHMSALKMLVGTMQACRSLAMNYALIGNPQLAAECKNLEETRFWDFNDSVESAVVQLNKASTSAAAPQLASA